MRLWSTRPSFWLILSSVIDLLFASTLANRGIAMASLPLVVVGGTFGAAVVFAFLVDIAKVPVFNRLGIV
jgi:H+-transporting ATPase